MNLVDDIPITEDGFEHVSCVIEIPKGTNTKYEYNEKLNVFELERCLVSSLEYPVNYGFISQTFALDNDCLLYTSPSPRDATLSRMPSSA